MTATDSSVTKDVPETDDRFLAELRWLIQQAGGVDGLSRASAVGKRTLQDWQGGRYPRHRASAALLTLHDWAARTVDGYPHNGLGLVELAIAPRAKPVRRRRPRWVWIAAAAVVVIIATALTLWLMPSHARPSVLPTGPAGQFRTEQTGGYGANLFADPRTLRDQQAKIPPYTNVQVGCRFYAPNPPSVTPDGYWYRITAPSPYAGYWAPANSFMNGDRVGGPTLHNTDMAVPICR